MMGWAASNGKAVRQSVRQESTMFKSGDPAINMYDVLSI